MGLALPPCNLRSVEKSTSTEMSAGDSLGLRGRFLLFRPNAAPGRPSASEMCRLNLSVSAGHWRHHEHTA